MKQQSTPVQIPIWETGLCASLWIISAARACYAVFEASNGQQFLLLYAIF